MKPSWHSECLYQTRALYFHNWFEDFANWTAPFKATTNYLVDISPEFLLKTLHCHFWKSEDSPVGPSCHRIGSVSNSSKYSEGNGVVLHREKNAQFSQNQILFVESLIWHQKSCRDLKICPKCMKERLTNKALLDDTKAVNHRHRSHIRFGGW